MHNKRKMYLLRLTALKLRYDVDECYDLASFYLILKIFLMQFRWNLFNFLAWRWNFHFRNVVIMPYIRFMIMFQQHTNEM